MTEGHPWSTRLAAQLVKRRAQLPAWLRRLMESVAKHPDRPLSRLVGTILLRGRTLPAATSVPQTPVRVLIAPTNYAGQGWQWARSLERADSEVGARNLSIEIPGTFAFPADSPVPIAVNSYSRPWASREFEQIRQFTHVLIEAERPIFGRLFGRDLRREITALGAAGISIAFLAHGTDIRSPRRHLKMSEWSHYTDDATDVEELQRVADANLELLETAGRPVFVSTPDLLADVPMASWCPVVVDIDGWAIARRTQAAGIPVVGHVPSDATGKGTRLILPIAEALHHAQAIELRLGEGILAADMPDFLAGCDIVLDQFRSGSYGVAACEAMAAGKVVVGHVLPAVRAYIADATGIELPIVEATPDTIEATLSALAAAPERRTELSLAGIDFVERVHSGALSAQVLLDGWIRHPN